MVPKIECKDAESVFMSIPAPSAQSQESCEHSETITGSAKGIRRDVCKNCGYVRVRRIDQLAPGDIGDHGSSEDETSV